MDTLLNPNPGIMIWTIVTFLVLLLVLTKTAWKPILDGLNQREGKIRNDLDRAEKSQKEAEELRLNYERQLAEAQKTIQEMVNQAKADGEKTKSQILSEAKSESDRILEKGRKDLSHEVGRLKGELRQEVAGLSVQVAEKIMGRSVDKKVQEEVLKTSLTQLNEVKK
ncbi:ATP synthase F0 subunit B [bacterium F11]|nr:ATP synthase F0 subunit B [bacterium F11]